MRTARASPCLPPSEDAAQLLLVRWFSSNLTTVNVQQIDRELRQHIGSMLTAAVIEERIATDDKVLMFCVTQKVTLNLTIMPS